MIEVKGKNGIHAKIICDSISIPFEHQAGAYEDAALRDANFVGWNQYRTFAMQK